MGLQRLMAMHMLALGMALSAGTARSEPETKAGALEQIVREKSQGFDGIFDYLPLADNINHVAHRNRLMSKLVELAQGASRQELVSMYDSLVAYADSKGVFEKFDNLLTESIAADKRVAAEWLTGAQLKEKYSLLIGKYKDGDPRIFFVNALCEILQRDEYNKIRERMDEFRLQHRVRLVSGGSFVFANTPAQVKELTKLYEHLP